MPKQNQTQAVNFAGTRNFAELVAKRPVIFGEDPGAYQTFHAHLITTLKPKDPYECVLADELVNLCWTINQTRHQITSLMRANLADRIYNAALQKFEEQFERELQQEQDAHIKAGGKFFTFKSQKKRTPDEWEERAEDLAERATSIDTDVAIKADAELRAIGVDPTMIMHEAFFKPGKTHRFDRLEERQRSLERRRRELQRDYERLQDRRPIDAEAREL